MDTGEVQKRNCNAPCSHEEADTRLILHAAHVGKSAMKKVMIKTVDTDVVVLAISFFSECSLDELWVEFGSGKYHRYIPIHVLHKAFTEEQAQALIGFHAFTGCDQVSAFGRRGKKSAWNILKSLPSVTPVFQTLSSTPTCAQVEECFPEIKRFVVLLYDRSSECENTNRPVENFLLERIARLKLCLQHLPTSAALLQHTLMSAFQGGFCWGQSPCCSTNDALFKRLWMDKKMRTRPVVTTVDDPASSCEVMYGTDQMWMQSREGLQRPM